MINRILFASILLVSTRAMAQFGFERQFDVEVTKNSVLQTIPWTGGMDYCQFSNIDFDFDGDLDLFVFDRTCDKVLTFIQNGGTGVVDYDYAPEYEDLFPVGLRDWALLVDYNCDGLPDLFTYTIGGCRVFKNTGSIAAGHEFTLEKPILKTTLWSEGYMYFSSIDVPFFGDIDGDSDIDVLSFGVLGTAIEYHKNMSMENYGNCDTLEFVTKNECWGRFRESGTTNEVTLWDTLVYPCNGTIASEESWRPNGPGSVIEDRHSGSSVLAFDSDNSNTMDLLLGDISYPSMVFLHNSGTVPNTNSGMDSQDITFPSYDVPVDLTIFPAAYHVDVDNDGNRDLLISPASKVGSENRYSVHYFNNTDADLTPVFDYQQNDFLQGNMIDHGSGALPVFFDANGDGLKDLLVSCHGMYDTTSGNQISKIAYYENIGTLAVPAFKLVTQDYEDISTMAIGTSLSFYPTFGDLDNDGDEDMILGEYTGYCYYMENTGGAGNPAIFNTFTILNDNTATPIFDATYVYPNLVDLDRDGDLDLVLGQRSGMLRYYENIGTPTAPSFEWQTDNLGDVDVSEYWTVEGHSIPQFIDVDSTWHLVLGSKKGYLHYYDDIEGNLTGSWNLVDSTLEDLRIGTFSAPAIMNISDDNRLEMVLGNQRGGVGFYKSAPLNNIGFNEDPEWEIDIYPNPAESVVVLDFSKTDADLENLNVKVYDVFGRVVEEIKPTQLKTTYSVNDLATGAYILYISDPDHLVTKKLVIK